MKHVDLDGLTAFEAVATLASFTRAAAELGTSQSALSRTVRALEERLGQQLLVRTTRSVAATAAGEKLLSALRPALEDIGQGLTAVSDGRDRPAGLLRITAVKHAALTLVRPMMAAFCAAYPDVEIEVDAYDGFRDIVRDRFDAGIRAGERIAKDMVAVRLGRDRRAAIVASPKYLAERHAPRTPRALSDHRCIGYRFATGGAVATWSFADGTRRFEVRVDGPLIFNDGELLIGAALDGLGIAYVWEDEVTDHLASGRLIRLLERWCPPQPGYFLYYTRAGRRQPAALAAFIAALRGRRTAAQ